MKFSPLFSVIMTCLSLGLAASASAQELKLSAVPGEWSAAQRHLLLGKRASLQEAWDHYVEEKAAFKIEFAGTRNDGGPRAVQAKTRRAELKAKGDALVIEGDRFNLTLEIVGLDIQIALIEQQLRGLGFKKSVPDFEWFKGQSETARRHMISQLVSRVRDLTTAKSESFLEKSFLAQISTMKPKEINKLADSLQRLGASRPLFQEWLRSFSDKLPRKVLVHGAKEAIDAIKYEEKLFKFAGQMDGTVQGQQEAALILISMFGADYPMIKELKLVASSSYDMIEAWATIYILDNNIDELMSAVEIQLVNQKTMVLRYKALVDKRRAAKEKLAKLSST